MGRFLKFPSSVKTSLLRLVTNIFVSGRLQGINYRVEREFLAILLLAKPFVQVLLLVAKSSLGVFMHSSNHMIFKSLVLTLYLSPLLSLLVAIPLSISFGVCSALDGSLYTWNGNTLTSSQKVHKGAVYCVRCINGVFYSGAKDGILCVYEPGTLRVSKKFDLNQVMHTNADSNHIKSIDTLDGQKVVSFLSLFYGFFFLFRRYFLSLSFLFPLNSIIFSISAPCILFFFTCFLGMLRLLLVLILLKSC